MADRFPYPLREEAPGRRLYRARVEAMLNLRTVSGAAGLTARELGDLEHGRLHTTSDGWGALFAIVAELKKLREAGRA